MTKPKFLIHICAGAVAVLAIMSAPAFVYAGASFTEIMYDAAGTDTGHEWMEIQNTGDGDIDLSSWKLFEANTNHKLSAVAGSTVASGGFAIVVTDATKFMADNPGFSGLIFTSSFSLSNTGEALVLRDSSLVDIDSVTYDPLIGAAGDGNTLQKNSAGVWTAAASTPGKALSTSNASAAASANTGTASASSTNQTVDSGASTGMDAPVPVTENEVQTYSSYSSQEVANTSLDAPEFEVTSGRARFGFVGVPLEFRAKIKSVKNMPPGKTPTHDWSWGDGTRISGQVVSHVYEYPGDYIAILNSEYGAAQAVSKVIIKIIEPKIEVVTASGEYVEIANRDDKEMNLGAWKLESAGGMLVLPQDTIIKGKATIKMPLRMAKAFLYDGYVSLVNPSGRIVSTYVTPQDVPELPPVESASITAPEGEEPPVAEATTTIAELIQEVVPEPAATTSAVNLPVFVVPDNRPSGVWSKLISLFKNR
jgi:hypothetical protein